MILHWMLSCILLSIKHKKEMETLCEQETSHEWKAERLNDYNLSHLQRFGSTPQKCAYCYKSRPLEEYSDMIIKQESL
jgi:hypothetical protein